MLSIEPEMRGEGKTEAWIEVKRHFVKKGLKLYRRDPNDGKIIWTPSEFRFRFKEDDVTVEQYYLMTYGYQLKYPEVSNANQRLNISLVE